MKRLAIFSLVLVLFVSSFCLTGCGEGQGITTAERDRMYRRTNDVRRKQFNDDVSEALLLTTPSRLSEGYVR